jgi:hypothetical protein
MRLYALRAQQIGRTIGLHACGATDVIFRANEYGHSVARRIVGNSRAAFTSVSAPRGITSQR